MVRIELDSVELLTIITTKMLPIMDIPEDEYPVGFVIGWMVKNYQIDAVWDGKTANTEYGSWIFSKEKYTEFCLKWM